jgi:serine/threonine kinase 38
MQALGLSANEQHELKQQINHGEAQQLREDRKRITILDFKPVRIIGKGAFG